MQPSQDPPPALSLLPSPGQNHNVGDEGHTLHDDSERHKEPDRAPHAAEVSVMLAVRRLRELGAIVVQGGAASVEAVGVMNAFAGGLRQSGQVSKRRLVVEMWGNASLLPWSCPRISIWE